MSNHEYTLVLELPLEELGREEAVLDQVDQHHQSAPPQLSISLPPISAAQLRGS